jgi:hypothetical protein
MNFFILVLSGLLLLPTYYVQVFYSPLCSQIFTACMLPLIWGTKIGDWYYHQHNTEVPSFTPMQKFRQSFNLVYFIHSIFKWQTGRARMREASGIRKVCSSKLGGAPSILRCFMILLCLHIQIREDCNVSFYIRSLSSGVSYWRGHCINHKLNKAWLIFPLQNTYALTIIGHTIPFFTKQIARRVAALYIRPGFYVISILVVHI